MQCNYNSFIQIINFHGPFRNALRCRKTGACRILVPLRYFLKFICNWFKLSNFFSFSVGCPRSLWCTTHRGRRRWTGSGRTRQRRVSRSTAHRTCPSSRSSRTPTCRSCLPQSPSPSWRKLGGGLICLAVSRG